MKRYLYYFLGLILLGFTSCEMLETHPYDTHISGEKQINQKNIRLIEQQLQGRHEFRFAVISDTQRWYDETEEVVNAINSRGDVDFVIHCGDLADYGVTNEFVWMRDILNKLTMPYVCTIGNHDCLGSGEDSFWSIFGDPNLAFTAGNVRFVGLNTNALEYDYSEPVPDFSFIEQEQKNYPDSCSKTVVFMHAGPGSDVFNNNVKNPFQYYLRQFPALQFCLYGHSHQLSVDDLYGDGILYYQCPNIFKRKYLLFTIHEEEYDYEAVPF